MKPTEHEQRYKGAISTYVMVSASVLVVILLLAGLGWHYWRGDSSRSISPEQVIIATNTEYVGSCPIFAARKFGYFEKEGIRVVIQPYSSGKAALDAALRGDANLGTVADIPIVFAAIDKKPVLIIATIFKTEKDHGIVGRKDRGVTSPASLKGKQVGVTVGTSGHFVLDVFLNRQQLSANDVTIHNLPPEEYSSALKRGDVDAIATWEPFLHGLLGQLGSNGTIFTSEDLYEIPYNIAGKREYILSHPETMAKVLRALLKGVHFCSATPDAARSFVSTEMKLDLSKSNVPWSSYRFKISLDQSLVLALEDETRWAMTNHLVSGAAMPNYLSYLYLDGLESVAPAAVTVIH